MSRFVPDDGRKDARFVNAQVRVTDLLRFMTFLQPIENGCWLWKGGKTKKGYAEFWWNGSTDLAMHFILYCVGRWPRKGLEPDHLCRFTECVNPDHLDVVTRRENLIRGESPVGKNARKFRCISGHAFNKKNTYIHTRNGHPQRYCRTCRRLSARMKYQQGNKDARKIRT